MAVFRKRHRKGRIVPASEERGGDVQISSSGATIRLTWRTGGLVLAVVLAVVVLIRYSGIMDQRTDVSHQAGAGAGQAGSAGMRPADNKSPAVVNAVIVPSDPSATTTLEVSYIVNDPEGDAVTSQFRWFVDGNLVQDGPGSTLQPGSYREGSSVRAEIIPADQYSSGSVFATAPVIIPKAMPEVTAVTLSPESAYLGSLITATPSGAGLDGAPITFQYQWRVNGSPVGTPSSQNLFDTSGLRKRDSVSVMGTYSDGQVSFGPIGSNTIILQNRKPEIVSRPPLGLQGGNYLYQVVARDPDGDSLKYRLERFPQGMAIDTSTGLITWVLPKGVLFSGRNEIKVAVMVDDGDGGTDSQEYEIVLNDVLVY